MGNKTGFEFYCVIIWSQYREPVCCLFLDAMKIKEVVWQKFIEVDRILLGGIPFCEFLSWVSGTDSDWVGELEVIDWVSLDIPHQYVHIKGILPRVIGKLI